MPPGTQRPRRTAFYQGLRDALRATDLPAVAFANEPPLRDSRVAIMVRHPHEMKGPIRAIALCEVSPNYFDVLGIRVVAGRVPVSDEDRRELVVSESAARQLWPNENPIGKELLSGSERSGLQSHVVVGVAEDVLVRSLTETEPVIYHAVQYFSPTLLVRSLSPTVVERVRSWQQGWIPRS